MKLILKALIGLTLIFNFVQGEEILDISSIVTPIIQKYQVPSMSVAIVQGDKVIALGADGIRSRNNPTKVTINDLYHLGSCTKSMTSTLIAMLVSEGLLQWDLKILEVFPELAGKINPAYQTVTLKQLLTHTSGLPANIDYWQIHQANPNDVKRAREQAVIKGLATSPVTSQGNYFYSNLGYIIAGHMAERVTGTRWEDLMRNKLFSPLGLPTMGFGAPGNGNPYGHQTNGTPVSPGVYGDNAPLLGPAGTVHGTLKDWAKYVGNHLMGIKGNSSLLSQDQYRNLHTPYPGTNYALGWLILPRGWGNGNVMTHSGTNTYWYSVVWAAPNRNFAVLVAVNQGGDNAAFASDEAAGQLILYFNSLVG